MADRERPTIRQRWKKLSRRTRVAVWVVIIVVIAVAGSGGKGGGRKGSGSSTSSSVAAPVGKATTSASKPQGPEMPQSQKEALSWIKEHGQDARRVAASVEVVQIAVDELQKEETSEKTNEAAKYAQEAHNNIDEIRQEFATGSYSGEVENASLGVFSSANSLKNAMGALVAYLGNPNPATLAHFTTQYEPAKNEWDEGIRAIYKLAHQREEPTIP